MRTFQMTTGLFVCCIALFLAATTVHAQDKRTYQVTTDNLKVRSAADANADVVGYLQNGDNITTFKEEHGWMLTYYEGEEAWIAAHYLTPIEQDGSTKQSNHQSNKITITQDAVHVRAEPGLNQPILDIVYSGDTFTLLDTKNDWHYIQLKNGTNAWVASWLTSQPVNTKQTKKNTKVKSNTHHSTKSSTKGQPLSGYNIILDPSHGGKDPGSIGLGGVREKDLALEYSRIVANKLQEQGATVLLTRSADEYVALPDRVRISEAYATDAFISLHFNAYTSSTPNGISTHYYDVNQDLALAQHVQNALNQHTTLHDRGVRQDNYHVLRKNRDTSILVELGFITNPSDVELIQNKNHMSSVATAIAEGLNQYFN